MECAYASLERSNQLFIENLQKVVRNKTGNQPAISTIINAALLDYQRTLEREAEPDFLTVYRKVVKRAKHR